MKRTCYALDLKNEPDLIAEYDRWHKAENGWPEVRKSILDAGIIDMQIYRTGNRLFMIMETHEHFKKDEKDVADAANPKVQQWEALMWQYQHPLPWAAEGEKWVLMERIFHLNNELP